MPTRHIHIVVERFDRDADGERIVDPAVDPRVESVIVVSRRDGGEQS
jgi:hypothetical protein